MPLDPQLLQLYLLTALVLTLMPGPDTLLVTTRALTHGRPTALVATAGITVGNVVHAMVAATGVAAVIAASPPLFDGLRTAGAVYLVGLGLLALRSAVRAMQNDGAHGVTATEVVAVGAPPAGRVLLGALLTNLLNAKVILFYLSFVPQFVDPARGSVGVQTFLLGLILAGFAAVYLGLVAVVGAAVAHRAYASTKVRAAIDAVAGLLFIAYAVRLLTMDRRLA